MSKRQIAKVQKFQPMVIGCYTLTSTGLEVKGRPTFGEHEGVGDFIQQSHRSSGFWLADWLRYGETRADWGDRLSQAVDSTGLTEKTLKNVRAVGAIDPSRRRDELELGYHARVAALSPDEQSAWLSKAIDHGWTVRELGLEIRAARRRKIIEGQAVLAGMYRVFLVDYPWTYGNRPPSGSGQAEHYPGMPIDEGCRLPVAAHALPDAVMFFWVTAPFLYYASNNLVPDAYRLIRAWDFWPKTGLVWDKVNHVFGNYVSIRHEHLIICTRGSCTPDRPTPMFDSVLTERQDDEHSGKPESVRQMIERLYDGPYAELFGRERHAGWDVFGNDAALWHQEVMAL